MTVSSERRLVIDNGSYYCRAGFNDASDPTSSVRALVLRPRRREDGQLFSLVGDVPPCLLVGTDAARAPVKSPFESNVVINFEVQETIFDFVLSRVQGLGKGNEAGALEHEVVLTECVLNPQASRQAMAELMFETYGCPGLHLGPDATFAYAHNRLVDGGNVKSHGLVVGMGHSATNFVPIVDDVPDFDRALRMNLSGMGMTTQLQRCLEVKYGKSLNGKDHPLSGFNLVEKIKAQICLVALDYREELKKIGRSLGKGTEALGSFECPDATGVLPALDLNTAVERIQIPEIYFQPSIAGIDQMNITDTVEAVCSNGMRGGWSSELLESVLITGGGSKFKGMAPRLQRELKSRCKVGTTLNVLTGKDASLDAWRGAAAYSSGLLSKGGGYATFVDKKGYEEMGANRVFLY
ncbi:actin [Chloropicon primus]|nr:actin [Chloropicon primus]|mmetsp:Transcript_6395/g.18951  ORF Transcript_6395/g.18951 Transcript_6395/m.18951 type:complete len:409 (-) Transcript_6395:1094-2320(-)